MSHRTLRLGPLDAERHWRPPDLAALPAVEDRHGARVVEALDECLAALCAPGDVLVTRHPLPASFVDALGDAGMAFGSALSGPIGEPAGGPVDGPEGAAAVGPVGSVVPWAWVPVTVAAALRLAAQPPPPPLGVVAEVNSKTWSNAVVAGLGLPGAGVVVRSPVELRRAVTDPGRPAPVAGSAEPTGLATGPVVVKDPFGVAGRGCLEVGTPRVLDAVVRALEPQAAAGRPVELLVQRRLPVRRAVSAHLDLAPDGAVAWRGVAVTEGRGFGYSGSRPAPPALVAHLEGAGHRQAVAAVAEHLAAAGYHGPVCVDGLVLADGGVVPVLEVNARLSMGRICLELDRRTRRHGLRARLVQRDVGVDGGAGADGSDTDRRGAADAGRHAALVGALRAAGVLHRTGATGVLPLTANTLPAPRGRLLCALVTRDGAGADAAAADLESALAACLPAAGLRDPRPAARVA